MGNRFHNKFHRHNHHSAVTPSNLYPDSGYDPIASRESPFKGEFYTEGDITTTQSISANSLTVSRLSATNIIQPIPVTTQTASKTFTQADANRMYHFDTSSSSLTAFFPNVIGSGFSTKVVNIGTNTLHLSAPTLNTSVSSLAQYECITVYKVSSAFFAIRGI